LHTTSLVVSMWISYHLLLGYIHGTMKLIC